MEHTVMYCTLQGGATAAKQRSDVSTFERLDKCRLADAAVTEQQQSNASELVP